uniref:Transcription-repair-coupling factor n=1 Tax=Candidatus Kentrum eta TaxID=2126337 RepID=A0A450V410_9GAMM|nr:MAG: transcription-repair coupling factor (superfamily II helicase) [Candidatus Kentron sp. H]VFJ99542.1 MAG: transcription-repair coupling factor (superfamily II helicase) [Candidatus Kentron sp. H]VFK04423.1 MAG: transcription-repair coupling factor (superfamily II helicase) [Candidatus Kentron sp. H]
MERGTSPLSPPLPTRPGDRIRWEALHGAARGLAISQAARAHTGPVVVVMPDTASINRLADELAFFTPSVDDVTTDAEALPLFYFPDWETLPYDIASPHQDIISQRLATLYRLPGLTNGILLVPVATLMTRLAPRDYLEGNALVLANGDRLDMDRMRERFTIAGYRAVGQVMEHGEFAVRGSLLDLYPMGSPLPYRIDLLGNEVDSIRVFDPETQRSLKKVSRIDLLPAREFPMTEAAIHRFRGNWRTHFSGNPTDSLLYRDISNGVAPSGIEYYLPLFFKTTATLFDYLPGDTLVMVEGGVLEIAEAFWGEVRERFEQRRYDQADRPPLPPATLFLQAHEVFAGLRGFRQVRFGRGDAGEEGSGAVSSPEGTDIGSPAHASPEAREPVDPSVPRENTNEGSRGAHHFATRAPLNLPIDSRAPEPLAILKGFLRDFQGRVLFVAETPGRREVLQELFHANRIRPIIFPDWHGFLASDSPLGLTVAALEQGAILTDTPIAVLTETQLFGRRAMQRRRRKRPTRDAETIVRDLVELAENAPVVHEVHGVGRYRGLETLTVGGITSEFLTLEYQGGDRLYVPVADLHLVARYTGADADHAPWHKLGHQKWLKVREKAAQKAYDVAAELLDIQARREARKSTPLGIDEHEQRLFAEGFPFEETPDQQAAIADTLADLASSKPTDRLICGDVGFGKTEVAIRAAFAVVNNNHQVAILVPTTLLAQQHFQTFSDRFADWPIKVAQLFRFLTKPQQNDVLKDVASGRVDIVIGTHRLLQSDVEFKRLGLVILDEEHRFGVRQKERFKALRAEVNVLTLTATPIPRTLNMALSGMRDLSLIATPPERRLSIKTFIRQWDDSALSEAMLREIRRGGQVYFVHNRVEDIEKIANQLRELLPDARVEIAHGQMPESQLEQVMLDFYHQRFNVLVCTTVIEAGIDVPSANTIIIHRADRFGLAQLHQLRGRVGRSHHRAYAYLIVPPKKAMTPDAVKRLEAIEQLEDLGVGFSLATHDLEIRGAGELLGQEQSGQIQEVGYSLYMDLLERAIAALKAGRMPQLDRPLEHGSEIDLHIPALIPDDYLPDIHARLLLYKRIAGAEDADALQNLQVEMIDRFSLLPEPVKNLFHITEFKLKANALGIKKIDFGDKGGRILFGPEPNVDVDRIVALIQGNPRVYKLEGGDKLRVMKDTPDGAERVKVLGKVLAGLGV